MVASSGPAVLSSDSELQWPAAPAVPQIGSEMLLTEASPKSCWLVDMTFKRRHCLAITINTLIARTSPGNFTDQLGNIQQKQKLTFTNIRGMDL